MVNDSNVEEILFEKDIKTNYEGRPSWWYMGSFFLPKTTQEHRLATLHRRTIVKNEQILSQRAQRIQIIIAALSEWFPLPLLDEVGKKFVQMDDKPVYGQIELVLVILGGVEFYLRLQGSTIRWRILTQINVLFDSQIKKIDYLKWVFMFARQKKEKFDSYQIVKKIALEEISQRRMQPEKKRSALISLTKLVRILENKNVIMKDYEVYGLALTRYILQERGCISGIASEYRIKVSKALNRIKALDNN
ncbi:MAG: hypothetical protein ACFFBD_27840 [Candidatus Hodarchaeota archaeon]